VTRSVVSVATLVLLVGVTAGPAESITVFGVVNTGELHVSTDSGASWSPRATLPMSDAIAIAARASSSDLYLARRGGGVYHSTDAGVSWSAVGGVISQDVVDLAIQPDGDIYLLAATGVVYVSHDGGVGFSAAGVLNESNFVSLAVSSSGTLYALNRTGLLAESTDGGSTWTAKAALTLSDAVEVRVAGSTLYILSAAGAIVRSTDGGTGWTTVGALSHSYMSGLVWDGTHLLAASREGDVATSTDAATWSWQGSINQLRVEALGVDVPAMTGGSPNFTQASMLDLRTPRPNPSHQVDRVAYPIHMSRPEYVRLELLDVQGRVVARRPWEYLSVGSHALAWDLHALRPGVYNVIAMSRTGARSMTRWTVLR
jgi:photosystem II stability/assembly factor-like uncharacterized protein